MNYYEILGLEKNASKEEIQAAYDAQVKRYKEEIKDDRRLQKFLSLFKEAYDALMEEKAKEEKLSDRVKEISATSTSSNENFENYIKEKDIDREYYSEEYNGYDSRKSRKNKSKSRSKSSTKNSGKKNNKDNVKSKKEEKYKKDKVKASREKNNSSFDLIKLPFKIVAFAIVVVLSIIIFVLKVISLATWLVSKLLIIASIGISSIHGYQIYMGQGPDYRIFFWCGVAFIISLFLPSIVKTLPSILESINNKLKNFVFG